MTPEQQQLLNEHKQELLARLQPVRSQPETSAHDVNAQVAEPETKRLVRKFERENQELEEGVREDIEFCLQEIPTDVSDEEKLDILKANNRLLTDIVNNPDQQPKKPKFGSGLAVSMSFKTPDGEIKHAWVDESQVDVDSGERYKFSQELAEQHKDLLDERRKEKANEAIAAFDRKPEPHSQLAMTKEEYDLEKQKKFPVFRLPTQPGPAWDDSILYGASGDLVRKAAQFSESHPAGMLVDFLVSIGSIIGRGPYFSIGATKHFTNEFMIRVGDSAKSRKGGGRDAIDEVLKMIDPKWYSDRVESGFGSAEAIISLIRDGSVEQKMNPQTGKTETVIVPGIQDKRLNIREGEAANVLVLASQPGSRVDVVLRDGWDGKPLRNIVKGRGKDGFSNSAKCEEPHISISADTTIHELRQKMPGGADENGFANRFLYVYVHRTQYCAQGSPQLDWTKEIVEFQQIVQHARMVKHVSMTNAGRQWWNDNYIRFEQDGPDGLAGKMTTRAAAHIRRLAMLYALLDMSDQIDLEDFQAAARLWEYCEESAMFIFGGGTKEQLRLVKWVEQRGTATIVQIREELHHRNKLAADIRADVDQLVKAGKLAVKNGVYAASQNAGRLAA